MTRALPIPTMIEPVPRAARFTTIFLIGRMFNGSRDDLCRVRDISAGGMRIETLAPVDVGQRIGVDLKNGATVRSEVVWVGKAEAGVRFDAPLDLEKVLRPPNGRATRAARGRYVRRGCRHVARSRCAATAKPWRLC